MIRSLADCYKENDQYEIAINLLEELLEKQKSIFGITHSKTLKTTWELVDFYRKNKQYENAIKLVER